MILKRRKLNFVYNPPFQWYDRDERDGALFKKWLESTLLIHSTGFHRICNSKIP